MKKLPFFIMPGSWGLRGKTRKIAQAEYELSDRPFDLDVALLKIDLENVPAAQFETTLNRKMLDINLKHGKITQEHYEREVSQLELSDDVAKEIAGLELDLKYHKISQAEFDKKWHTVQGKPWVSVGLEFDPKNVRAAGAFDLSWNEYFVKELLAAGYTGNSPQEVVQLWFDSLCRTIAQETGILSEPEVVGGIDPNNGRRDYF